MLELVTSTLATVISWCGTVITEVVGAEGALHDLAPLWVVGIAVSALMLGAKVLSSFSWGS